MKILLLEHPRRLQPDRCNDIANTPLSSCLNSGYIAGMLESKGHRVKIVEGYLDRLSYEEITNIVEEFKPDILGVHMVYHWQFDQALHGFLDKVKKAFHHTYITSFGFFPTNSFAEVLQKYPQIASVILGEPEVSFSEVVEAISSRASLEGLPGLAVADEDGTVRLQRREPVQDLDSLPFPIRTRALLSLPEVNLMGSRGCYGGCTFCYINPFYGQGSRWRGRSPKNIISEIDEVIAATGVRDFYFTDPNFFGPGQRGQERALQLAGLLQPRNIRFGIEARVNDIHDETIEALVKAGLRHLLIGLESGKDSSLQRMNKKTTVAQNERALKVLRKHGLEPNVGFIMFEPDSNLEDIRINFEFLKRNELLKNLAVTANLLYHHQIILKGTTAYDVLLEEGRLHVESSLNHEGTGTLSNPEVGTLAEILRQITNHLFLRMGGIWSGKVIPPENAEENYGRINRILVEVFEDSLAVLEAGRHLTKEDISRIVRQTVEAITSSISEMMFLGLRPRQREPCP
ncbi:MAG TPA: radical SAM protein [Bacillota bacterium]|nr:radical SAM protein [Bacillota bacterium]